MVVAVNTPLKWLGGQIDVSIEIATVITPEGGGAWDVGEWDSAVWAEGDLSFQTISDYCMRVHIRRGQERWDSRYTAGTATFWMDNTTGLFTPNAGEDPWSAPFRPGRLIRVVIIPNPDTPEVRVVRFTGRIDSSNDEFTNAGGNIITVIHAVDALGDLHDHNPPALTVATGVEDTDERVVTALDNMGWPEERRQIQPGLHTMQTSFLAQTTLEECQRAADAEGGAFYANGDGVVVFKNRDWLFPSSSSMDYYEAAVLAKGPVAYWRMGDDTDRTVDSTGNGHTLTWNGSPASGVTGVTADDIAIPLDGTNDYATVASEGDIELLQDMSIEAWVRFASTGGWIISVRDGSGNYIFALGSVLSAWGFAPANTGSQTAVYDNISLDVWTHVVVTIEWDGANRRVRFYLNGQQSVNTVYSYQPSAGSYTANIGRRPVANDQFFDGDISELVFYDRVLSAAEILQNYNAKDTSNTGRSTTIQGYIGYGDDLPDEYDGEPTAEIVALETNWEIHRVRNDIQFARDGGELQQVDDTDSQTVNGVRTYSRRDFHNNDDAEVLFLAERNLAAYKDARPRIDTVTIAANDDPTNDDLNRLFWDSQFGDMLSINVATLHGWSYEREVHVIGMEDEITAEDWVVKFTLDDSIIEAIGDD